MEDYQKLKLFSKNQENAVKNKSQNLEFSPLKTDKQKFVDQFQLGLQDK